jgi:hypothetical protein
LQDKIVVLVTHYLNTIDPTEIHLKLGAATPDSVLRTPDLLPARHKPSG